MSETYAPPARTDTHDFEVEASIIGHCLTSPTCAGKLFDLKPEHFYSRPHSDIWQAICQLRTQGESIAPFTIAPLLVDIAVFEKTGGIHEFFHTCLHYSLLNPWPGLQEKYLIKLFKKRYFQETCSTPENPSAIAEAARELLQEECAEGFLNNFAVSEKILAALNENLSADSTGIAKLDEAMDGGLFPRKSYGFAARKKMGKTMLAGTISYHLNRAGVKHLFICGEMSPEEIHSRLLARELGIKSSALRQDYGKTLECGNRLAQAALAMPRNILYRNAPGMTFDEMKNIIETAIDIHKVKGIILDYWQLVGGKTSKQSTAEHLDDVAQWIADYCRKKDVWSIVMAQINQEGNTRGGEGIRLAFDQVYELKAPGDDPSRSDRWLEMRDTRYTRWLNIGSETIPGLMISEKGTHLEAV